jgi:hypothetical protein
MAALVTAIAITTISLARQVVQRGAGVRIVLDSPPPLSRGPERAMVRCGRRDERQLQPAILSLDYDKQLMQMPEIWSFR